MSCGCNCGCNSSPCKNLNVSDIGKLEFVQGLDDQGCPKYENISTLLPVVHPAATLTNNVAPFSWNVATQSGNIPQASRLVANADGSFTFIRGDGSPNVVIPKDCCPVMTQSGNTITFTNGDGSVVTFTLHPAATLTNNSAPFSWNVATQSGNVPQASRLIANADGSFTMVHGDGSPNVVIPKDCCPTMAMSGNTVTFTNGDGSVVTFTLHPAATLTNNAAPFSWNATAQIGNVPQPPTLTLTPTGFLFVPGDGSAPVVYTEPASVDTYITGWAIVGNQATITRSDGVSFTQTIPTTVDINVQSLVLSGSNLQLTETDGTVHTVPLPQEVKVNAVSYTPATGVLTISNTDGTNVSTTIDVCATLATLPTGAAGVAGTTQFLGKDCEWHALPAAGTFTETPLTVTDTATIDLVSGGTAGHALSANAKISATAGNAISANPDGLYACRTTIAPDASDCTVINSVCGGAVSSSVQLPLPEMRTSEYYNGTVMRLPGRTASGLVSFPTPTTVTFTLSKARRVHVGYKFSVNLGSPAIPGNVEGYEIFLGAINVNGVRACIASTRYEEQVHANTPNSNFGGDYMTGQTYIDLPAGTHTIEAQYSWTGTSDPAIIVDISQSQIFAEWIAYDCETGEVGTTATGCGAQAVKNW